MTSTESYVIYFFQTVCSIQHTLNHLHFFEKKMEGIARQDAVFHDALSGQRIFGKNDSSSQQNVTQETVEFLRQWRLCNQPSSGDQPLAQPHRNKQGSVKNTNTTHQRKIGIKTEETCETSPRTNTVQRTRGCCGLYPVTITLVMFLALAYITLPFSNRDITLVVNEIVLDTSTTVIPSEHELAERFGAIFINFSAEARTALFEDRYNDDFCSHLKNKINTMERVRKEGTDEENPQFVNGVKVDVKGFLSLAEVGAVDESKNEPYHYNKAMTQIIDSDHGYQFDTKMSQLITEHNENCGESQFKLKDYFNMIKVEKIVSHDTIELIMCVENVVRTKVFNVCPLKKISKNNTYFLEKFNQARTYWERHTNGKYSESGLNNYCEAVIKNRFPNEWEKFIKYYELVKTFRTIRNMIWKDSSKDCQHDRE